MKRFLTLFSLLFLFTQLQAQIMDPVKWKITLEDSETAEKTLVFTATIDAGWHLYDQDLPSGGPVSTSFDYETVSHAELVGKIVPSAKPTTEYDETFGMNLRWYSNTVTFRQKIKVTDAAKFKLTGEIVYMACNDETCLPPERVEFSFDKRHVKATVEQSAQTPAVKEQPEIQEPEEIPATEEPADQSSTGVVTTPNPPATGETSGVSVPPALQMTNWWKPVIAELKAFGDGTLSATDNSWLIIFLTGFLGGLVALLTPCVWPMIPMTVSFFLKRTKDRKKAIRDAVTYGISIIAIYLAMGLLITG